MKYCRLALPHEIPIQGVQSSPKVESLSLLEQAKLMYPVGTVFHSTGGYQNCTILPETKFHTEGNHIGVSNILYNNHKAEAGVKNQERWAQIVSKPAFDQWVLEARGEQLKTPWPIGTRVMLKKDSKFYYQAKGEVGIITDNVNPGSTLIYTVDWEKAHKNGYGQADLDLLQVAPYPEENPIIYGTGGEIPKRRFYKGDKVKFKTTNDHIPEYEFNGIPSHLIVHGQPEFKVNEGYVVDFHKEYIIVRYIDYKGKSVQLGFKEDVLITVYTAGYPYTLEEAYLAGYDPYQKEAQVELKQTKKEGKINEKVNTISSVSINLVKPKKVVHF